MTDIDVDIDVDSSGARRRIAGYERRTAQQVGPLTKARTYMEAANAANFTANGLPTGGWDPLAAQYGAWKAAHYPGAPPMVRTGRLWQSLISLQGRSFEIRTPTEAIFRLPNISYAKFHQYGTTKMPARQILFEPAGLRSFIADEVKDHILDEKNMRDLMGSFR